MRPAQRNPHNWGCSPQAGSHDPCSVPRFHSGDPGPRPHWPGNDPPKLPSLISVGRVKSGKIRAVEASRERTNHIRLTALDGSLLSLDRLTGAWSPGCPSCFQHFSCNYYFHRTPSLICGLLACFARYIKLHRSGDQRGSYFRAATQSTPFVAAPF